MAINRQVGFAFNVEGLDKAVKNIKDFKLAAKETEEAAKSLKDQFTEAEDKVFALAGAGKQNTAAFRKAQLEAAKLKERVDDINESLDQLKPEAKLAAFGQVAQGIAGGFAGVQGALALVGEDSEDLQKTLVKVQAAMAFSEGIKSVGQLQDGLKNVTTAVKGYLEGTKLATIAQKAWNLVMKANPLGLVIAGVTAFIGVLYTLSKALQSSSTEAEKMAADLDKLKAKNEELTQSMNRQIKSLSGLKENEEQIIVLKRELLAMAIQERKAAEALAKQKEKDAKAEVSTLEKIGNLFVGQDVAGLRRQVRIKQAQEETKKATVELKDAEADLSAFRNTEKQKELDNEKALADKRKAEAEKAKAEAEKKAQEAKARREKEKAELDRFNKQLEDLRITNIEDDEKRLREKAKLDSARRKKEIEDSGISRKLKDQLIAEEETNLYNTLQQINQDFRQKEEDEDEAFRQKKKDKDKQDLADAKALAEAQAAARTEAYSKSLDASQSLLQTFYTNQLNQAKGNEKRELEIRKRMFQVDKAFNLARTIQDGIRSVQAALTIPPPAGQILAVANAGLATANVAKIAATKFDGGAASGGGGGISVPTINSSAPVIPTPDNTVTNLGGKKEPIKTYVVETEISETQKKVNTIKDQNTF